MTHGKAKLALACGIAVGIAANTMGATGSHAAQPVDGPVPAAHVQLAVSDVQVPNTTPGECVMQATVVRVFGNGVQNGQPLTLPFDCRLNEETAPGTAEEWVRVGRVIHSRYLEAFLYRLGDTLTLRRGAFADLKAPSDTPVCGDGPPCKD